MHYCVETERAGKTFKVIWYSIELPAYFCVSALEKKMKQLQFQPWTSEGKNICTELCCWWLGITSEISLLCTNPLHTVQWKGYSSVSIVKEALMCSGTLMKQSRLVLLHIDHPRKPSETDLCTLFPPFLATSDTDFRSHMVIIHQILFRPCVEGWYTVVVEKKSLGCVVLPKSPLLKTKDLCSLLV